MPWYDERFRGYGWDKVRPFPDCALLHADQACLLPLRTVHAASACMRSRHCLAWIKLQPVLSLTSVAIKKSI